MQSAVWQMFVLSASNAHLCNSVQKLNLLRCERHSWHQKMKYREKRKSFPVGQSSWMQVESLRRHQWQPAQVGEQMRSRDKETRWANMSKLVRPFITLHRFPFTVKSFSPTPPLCPLSWEELPGGGFHPLVAAEEAAASLHWPEVWFGEHPATSHLNTCQSKSQ